MSLRLPVLQQPTHLGITTQFLHRFSQGAIERTKGLVVLVKLLIVHAGECSHYSGQLFFFLNGMS